MDTKLIVLGVLLLLGGCTTVPQQDFRLLFLEAVQSDCAVDKVEMNGDAVRVKCFQQVEEKW